VFGGHFIFLDYRTSGIDMPLCLIVLLGSLKQRFRNGGFHTNAEVEMAVRGLLHINKPDFGGYGISRLVTKGDEFNNVFGGYKEK
jgi:hypothetical protein